MGLPWSRRQIARHGNIQKSSRLTCVFGLIIRTTAQRRNNGYESNPSGQGDRRGNPCSPPPLRRDRGEEPGEVSKSKLPEMVQRAAANMWGILCLSEQIASPDNLTMWAHYARAHSGFAIQFDTKHEFFKNRFIRRVDYSKERPVFTREKSSLETIQTVLVKSEEWRPEAEWRMFRSLVELESRELPDGKGHFAPLPSKCISAVFACRSFRS